VFQTRYLKVTFGINENIFHLYFTSTLKPIYNSITSGLIFYISGSFLFNTGASPMCSNCRIHHCYIFLLPSYLAVCIFNFFLSVYFLLFLSSSCISFYALCSSVVSCLSQGSFLNKFHKTCFWVRKDLECIVLKQSNIIWAQTVASFFHIMTLIFSALRPRPQSSLCHQSNIANTKTFNNHPSGCFVTHV